MNGGEHGAFQIVFVVSGSDTHILIVQIGSEGVYAGFNHAPVEIKTDMLCKFAGKFCLFFYIVGQIIKIFVDQMIIFYRPFNQRYDRFFQTGKEFVQNFGGKSFFIIVQKDIVERSLITFGFCLVGGKLFVVIDHFF